MPVCSGWWRIAVFLSVNMGAKFMGWAGLPVAEVVTMETPLGPAGEPTGRGVVCGLEMGRAGSVVLAEVIL